jgi:hypothetical protein
MNGGLSLAIPCRADEPGLGATLTSLFSACQRAVLSTCLIQELLICLNGMRRGSVCASLLAARAFCTDRGIPYREVWLTTEEEAPRTESSPTVATISDIVASTVDVHQASESKTAPCIPSCTILLTERSGKPPAWNILWRQAAGAFVLFCDADVRVDDEAVWFLYNRLQREPRLALVAAREVPVLEGGGTMWSKMGALPYRFDFGNAGGRLLVLRKDAVPDGMPEDLLLEDAWLTVAVGKHRVAKEWQARVYFLPPTTGRDYFAERVRTEGGKVQIRRVYGRLLEGGPIATYRWARFFTAIGLSEYPLVCLALMIRTLAWLWARVTLVNKDFYALYRPFLTTKDWSGT